MEATVLKNEIQQCLDMMQMLQSRRSALQAELDRLEQLTLAGSYIQQQDHTWYYIRAVVEGEPDYCKVHYDSVSVYGESASIATGMTANPMLFKGLPRISENQFLSAFRNAKEIIENNFR